MSTEVTETAIADEYTDALYAALQAIARTEYVCDRCGIEYIAGFEGNCQEPLPHAKHDGNRWSAMCSGLVSAAGTARWWLAKAAEIEEEPT